MKRIVTIVALICAMTFQVNAQQCRLEFEYRFNADTHDIDVNPNSGSVMYFPPQTYNEIVRRFKEFKDRCR